MPRPKKGSPEAKAWAADMKAKREANRANGSKQTSTQAPDTSVMTETIVQNDDVKLLLKRIEELESRNFLPAQNATPEPYAQNRVLTKYSINPKDYEDPRVRLSEEARLARFAFPINYDLSWNVERVNYEDGGQKYVAPRFVLELLGKVIDEDTNEPKKTYDPVTKVFNEQRYIIKRGIFLEDPDSYIYVANQNGYDIPESIQQDFIDEMRYLTFRDWLFGWFYPQLPDNKQQNKQEAVIGNRVVELYEVSSVEGSVMPFDQLNKKL